MKTILRSSVLIATSLVLGASLQGCLLAAGAAAGAAGGYEAKKRGYDVQSPVKKDAAGGYKGQTPVTKHPEDDTSSNTNKRDHTGSYESSGSSNDNSDYGDGTTTSTSTSGN